MRQFPSPAFGTNCRKTPINQANHTCCWSLHVYACLNRVAVRVYFVARWQFSTARMAQIDLIVLTGRKTPINNQYICFSYPAEWHKLTYLVLMCRKTLINQSHYTKSILLAKV